MFGSQKMVGKVMSLITDPEHMASYSTAEQIAELVYEAVVTEKSSSAI